MTYKTKNTAIVFAFAALLMVMPLTSSNAFGDGESSIDPDCGYDVPSNIAMGTIVRGSVGTEAAQTVFTAQETNSAGAIFSVTATTNWEGEGDRSSGTITIVNMANDEDVTVNSNAYTAKTSGAAGGQQFDLTGSDDTDAEAIALLINALDTDVRATTSGTNTITITADARGAGGDAIDIAEGLGDGGASVSGANLAGGGANNDDHALPTATAAYVTVNEGSSIGQTWDDKTQLNVKDTPREIHGATIFDKDVHVTFQTSAEYLTAADGTVTFSTVAVGDDITVNGLLYTAVAGAKGGNTEFSVQTSDTAAATDLADSIENDVRVGTKSDVGATSNAAVVTITSDQSGEFGNLITLATTDAVAAAVSAATLTGGTEHLINLPYDGALTMAVTFTVDCT